jgi:CRP/FNR family transcriptional regulator, cyclic AMP receptor protein
MNRSMRLVGKSETAEICSEIGAHNRCLLCDLTGESLRDFDAISLTGFYPRGAKLFTEGQRSRGVFILCSGRAKLSIGSSNGRSLMRVADQGEILGVSAALSGAPYDDTAEMLESGQVNFIRRDHFLRFLNGHPEAGLRLARQLNQAYTAVHQQLRSLALSDSAAEKLARLLLSWIEKIGGQTEQNIHLKLSLTHTEIAQMIGVSRETVTRLLGELRDKGIIQLKGVNLLIRNKAALLGMINS